MMYLDSVDVHITLSKDNVKVRNFKINTDFYSVRTWEDTEQKKLSIRSFLRNN